VSTAPAYAACWTAGADAHPHEALLGILALVHGTSSLEVRGLRAGDIDHSARAVRLGKRPHPVPLDPASWDALQRCLAHRDAQATENPHVMVTRGTRARTCAPSAAYVSHLLDPCGIPPRMLRSTRLTDLVNTHGPQARGSRVRHGRRERHDLPRRPSRPGP
jgi:integrase